MAYTTINKPNTHFNTVLRNGGGGTITGVGFQPDLVWQKSRNSAGSHYLYDAVRGVTKALFTNSTSTETDYGADQITSFDADGFTQSATGDWGSGTTIADWCWKAGNSAGVTNNSGSITSTVSANTTAGFSIVSYTANQASTATVGHGLGVAPSMIIFKERDGTSTWNVYHKSIGSGGNLKLNTTNGTYTSSVIWRNTAPTSSVFTLGEDGGDYEVNYPSGSKYIAYCFAEVKGFSKFGSYIGNGSNDGTFVYTGFKPAFILSKNVTTSTDWSVVDIKRNTYNYVDTIIKPNANSAESNVTGFGWTIDILSNGFKNRGTNSDINASGNTYIYMAFAEQPLVGTNNVPATAR